MEIKTKALRYAIEATVVCVDKDSPRFYLEHVLWAMAGDTLTLTGTDGIVISEVTTKIEGADETWSGAIHYRGCMALLEWLKDTTSVRVGLHEGSLRVGAHDSILSLMVFGGKVPSFEPVWNRAPTDEVWRGAVFALNGMETTINGVDVIPIGQAVYDPVRIKQVTKLRSAVIAHGKGKTDPVLFTMDNWRALVMPMTLGKGALARGEA